MAVLEIWNPTPQNVGWLFPNWPTSLFSFLLSFWWAALSQLSGLLQSWIIHVTRHYLDEVNNWNLCLKGFDVDERKGDCPGGRVGVRWRISWGIPVTLNTSDSPRSIRPGLDLCSFLWCVTQLQLQSRSSPSAWLWLWLWEAPPTHCDLFHTPSIMSFLCFSHLLVNFSVKSLVGLRAVFLMCAQKNIEILRENYLK